MGQQPAFQLDWQPDRAGGINLYEDATSIPLHQVVQLDNYYPVGRGWRLIEGNEAASPGFTSPRVRHLAEYQHDNTTGGTDKFLLSFKTSGIFNALTDVALTGPAVSSSETLLWDTTIFQGIFLMANGSDNLLESSNGTSYAATGGSPPSAPRYVEAWKNRVFLAGRNSAVLSVHYSADGDRTTWTGTDAGTEVITTPVGDFVTSIRSVENYLAMFTRRTITALVGDHPDDWTKRTVFEDHGCASHRTVARVNGGLIYANDFGVWFINADLKRVELSKDIRPYWQNKTGISTRRNKARGSFMHAVYDPTPDNNRYIIWVAEGSSTKEDVAWIFHFNNGQWSRMTTFMDTAQTSQASTLREDTSGNIEVYFAAGSDDNTTADKKAYKITGATSFASRTGGNIAATLKTGVLGGPYVPQLNLKGLMTTKIWLDFFAKFTAVTGSENVTFAFSVLSSDKQATQRTVTQSIFSASAEFVRPRVPISARGWAMQMTLTYTGQSSHRFIGGIFNFEDSGEM